MHVALVAPEGFGNENRTFACPTCKHLETVIVSYK